MKLGAFVMSLMKTRKMSRCGSWGGGERVSPGNSAEPSHSSCALMQGVTPFLAWISSYTSQLCASSVQ